MHARVLAPALLLLLCVVTGCAAGETWGGRSSTADPGNADVEQALLTVENLGDDFRIDEGPSAGGGDTAASGTMGCLDVLDHEVGARPNVDVGRGFELADEVGLPSVFTGIQGFRSAREARRSMDAFVGSLEGCSSVKETDGEQVTIELEVRLDTTTRLEHADQQVTLDAAGVVADVQGEAPWGMRLQVVRIGRHLVAVGFVDLAELRDEPAALLAEAVARFEALMAEEALPAPEPILADYQVATSGA